MLYQDRTLGRATLAARLLARALMALTGPRHADLDLLSMSAHLRRDIGMGQIELPAPFEPWRK
ncbi:MAG TPA: hypothetical protein VHA07_07200 [Devosia sp.]|nr:hypothetical protein [Devosia sp.]